MAKIDLQLFLWINSWVGTFPTFDRFVSVAVSDYLVPVLFSLVLLGLWFGGRDRAMRERHQRAVICAAIALAIANLIVMLFNDHFFRPRPFTVYEVNLLFYRPTDSSFPANPAVVAFAVAAGVWSGNRRFGAILYAVAALFGLGRVYAGVFYPFDVVAGALIGVATAYGVRGVLKAIEPLLTRSLQIVRFFHLA